MARKKFKTEIALHSYVIIVSFYNMTTKEELNYDATTEAREKKMFRNRTCPS